jgi:hypothetical protein
VAVKPRPDELRAGADDGHPSRQSLRWVVGLVVAGVALAILRPGVSLHGEATDPPPRVPNPHGPALVGVTWETRGDLAKDSGFVGAAVARIRRERPDVARVFFAGDLPDGRRLVLAGSDVGRGVVATAVHALIVDPGVPVEKAPVSEVTTLVNPADVLAWAGRGATGIVSVVAIARPGPARFEVSSKLQFGPDGEFRRQWTSVVADNGVAVLDAGSDSDPAVALRAEGSGVFQVAQAVRVVQSSPGPPPVLHITGVPAPGYDGPAPELLGQGVREALGSIADLSRSRVRVVWSGSPWKSRHLALVLVTRPDGVRLETLVGQQGPAQFPAGVRALAPGTRDDAPWLLEPFSPQDPTFLLCPTGAGTLIYSRPGRADRRLPIPASGAVVVVEPSPSPPSARGADVTLLDPSGRLVLRTTLRAVAVEDPLALSSGYPTEAAR